jgi:hypothetical protein
VAVCVYRGASRTDAYLVRDWLERNGIPVIVQGEALMSALGDLPVAEALPSCWVPEAAEQDARRLVEAFTGPHLVHPAWQCECGEENPPSFGSCWSCAQDRPGMPRSVAGDEDTGDAAG